MVPSFSQKGTGGLEWIEKLPVWQRIYILALLGLCAIPQIYLTADFIIKKIN